MEPESRAALHISAGGDFSRLIEHALCARHQTTESACIAVASKIASDGPATAALTDLLARTEQTTRMVVPPATLVGAWSSFRKFDWVAVELPPQAERLRHVWLPGNIVHAKRLIAINRLPVEMPNKEPIALGIWAQFAHPRQRTGAWLSDERTGLAAEIALAVKPDLILLSGDWRGFPFLISSDDQIAAELAGLAVAQTRSKTPPENGGPWEQPLVQRATELSIGVKRPGQIDANIQWLGADDSRARAPFEKFACDLLARMGVTARG